MLAIFLVTVFSCLLGAANVAAVGFGADCTSASCDANTECSSTTSKCVCVSGFTELSGVCTANGGLGTACLAGSACTGDTLVCDSNVCKKKAGQACGAVSECVSQSTCSTTCTCSTGYTPLNTGLCTNVAAVGLGGDCTSATCDANTKCSPTTNKCVCSDGFTEISGVCNGAAPQSVSFWLFTGSIITILVTLTLP